MPARVVRTGKSEDIQELLFSIIEGIPYGILVIDKSGRISVANNAVLGLLNLNFTIEHLYDKLITHVVSELELDELRLKIKDSVENRLEDFDVEEVSYQDKYLTFRGRKISEGMIITIADVTSIKEEEFASLNAMLEGQEQERKRLAREIHDGIGPILSTLKMNLANIESEIESKTADLPDRFLKSYEMIDEAADDLRSISHNLMPRALSDFGLIEALEALTEKVDRTKSLKVTFIQSGFGERLDIITEFGLYRISQELINNTLKHAEAEKITLQIINKGDTIQLMYEDDGKGFDTKKASRGIGLLNIESRAKALFGEVILDSHPGKGMTATIEIPNN